MSALGAVLTLAERVHDALSLLECAVETASSRGLVGSSALYLARLGEAYLHAGRDREAEELATRALETARRHKERGHEAWAITLLGQVVAERRPPDLARAIAHHRDAITLGEALGMRPLVAHGHLQLGTLHQRMGDLEQARDALVRAATMLHAMGMVLWLEKAEAFRLELDEAAVKRHRVS